MANFPTGKSLNLTMTGSVQTLGVTYKENFFIQNNPASSSNISILAGDDDVLIWVLAPGESFQVSGAVVALTNTLYADVPLKVQGTSGDTLAGFIA